MTSPSEPPVDATAPHVADAAAVRYRCTSCGNLTRFDVTTTRRTRAFHHYTVGGELEVEDLSVLAEELESVEYRRAWWWRSTPMRLPRSTGRGRARRTPRAERSTPLRCSRMSPSWRSRSPDGTSAPTTRPHLPPRSALCCGSAAV